MQWNKNENVLVIFFSSGRLHLSVNVKINIPEGSKAQ